jgi:hypothetical protein
LIAGPPPAQERNDGGTCINRVVWRTSGAQASGRGRWGIAVVSLDQLGDHVRDEGGRQFVFPNLGWLGAASGQELAMERPDAGIAA